MKLRFVEWVDSGSPGDTVWSHKSDVKKLKPIKCVTVGFIIKKTRKKITMASSVIPGQFSGVMCIPKGCITKIRRLK